MKTVTLAGQDDFDGWRDAARALSNNGVPPDRVIWQVGGPTTDLFARDDGDGVADGGAAFSVPRKFLSLAGDAILASDPERFSLLYMLLDRLRAEPRLIDDHADPLVRRLEGLAKTVRRDIHKMRAFLRFREVEAEGQSRYVAWYEPETSYRTDQRRVLHQSSFASMRWSILTPEISLHWNGDALSEGPGATKSDAPDGDPTEEVWKTYYAGIFNPARVKVGAMLKEMPRKYWKNLPETALIPALLASAQARESKMIETARSTIGGNARAAWEALRDEAAGCTRCPLYGPATQTVFGEGPVDADMMFVGEQPGDQEDLAGRPFVRTGRADARSRA